MRSTLEKVYAYICGILSGVSLSIIYAAWVRKDKSK